MFRRIVDDNDVAVCDFVLDPIELSARINGQLRYTSRIIDSAGADIFIDTEPMYFPSNQAIRNSFTVDKSAPFYELILSIEASIRTLMHTISNHNVMKLKSVFNGGRAKFDCCHRLFCYSDENELIDVSQLSSGQYEFLLKIGSLCIVENEAKLDITIAQIRYRPDWRMIHGFYQCMITNKAERNQRQHPSAGDTELFSYE